MYASRASPVRPCHASNGAGVAPYTSGGHSLGRAGRYRKVADGTSPPRGGLVWDAHGSKPLGWSGKKPPASSGKTPPGGGKVAMTWSPHFSHWPTNSTITSTLPHPGQNWR